MGFKDPKFNDRTSTAADAKKQLLEKFKAKTAEIDSTFEQRQVEAKAKREAKEVRTAEREAAKAAEDAKRAEEAARAKRAEADAEVAKLLEQKAERDARYAARKDRQKKKR